MAEDGSLSQDDIDALLGMGEDGDSSFGGGGGGDSGGGGGLDDLNLDALLGGSPGMGDSDGVGLDQASLDALAGTATQTGPRTTGGSGSGDSRDNVDLLMDVSLRFTVELGRTTMYIRDVLQLGEGSIVEMDKNVGDEVDILVNDRLFGRGKLIIMDEYFGVQITHIVDPLERYRHL